MLQIYDVVPKFGLVLGKTYALNSTSMFQDKGVLKNCNWVIIDSSVCLEQARLGVRDRS